MISCKQLVDKPVCCAKLAGMTRRYLLRKWASPLDCWLLSLALFLLVACDATGTNTLASGPEKALSQQPVEVSPTALPQAVTATALPSDQFSPIVSPSRLPTRQLIATQLPFAAQTPTPLPPATPLPTADPYSEYAIEALTARSYGGGSLEIIDLAEENSFFRRYIIAYPSDGLTIYGYMNVPNKGTNFPVAIVLHGYIPPEQYQIVTYTERYASALAEAGYFVIHPNFRNYPPSDNGPDAFRVGLATDILNLIAIIREQSQDPLGYLRRADADDINLWGHSMGGGVALRVITVNNAPYIRSAVLYGSMSGDEALNYEQIRQWSSGRTGDVELSAPGTSLQAISPVYHLDRIGAAISIHHSDSDDVVPLAWSTELCQQLEQLRHPVECFVYEGLPHTFRGPGDELFIRRFVDFFNRN